MPASGHWRPIARTAGWPTTPVSSRSTSWPPPAWSGRRRTSERAPRCRRAIPPGALARTTDMSTSTRRRLAASISAVVLAAVLTGCGGGGDAGGGGQGAEEPTQGSGYGSTTTDDTVDTDDTDDQAAGDVAITIVDFEYELPESVEPGATTTVTTEDDVGHTVTSDEEGIFDVVVGPGQTVDFTVPEEAGEYPFHCTPHPQMTSTLVVG